MWSLRTALVRFIQPRFKTPYLRNILITPVKPEPGVNLVLPDWTVEKFFKKIGGDTAEYTEKFEKLQQVFNANKWQLRELGVPARQRKYLKRIKEMLRRGVITFESLEKRTAVSVVKEEAPKTPVKGKPGKTDKKQSDETPVKKKEPKTKQPAQKK